MGVVTTTIKPPRAAHKYVRRESIEQLAKAVGMARVVTVSSPAGFGKTTAMLCWADMLGAQGRPVLWIAARAGIDSLQTFLDALGAASVAAGLNPDGTREIIGQRGWLASLSQGSGPRPILFIDDVQLLSAEIREFIDQLIASARDSLTTVIASRGESGINLARMRSLGHLTEVRVRHLIFDNEEASLLIQQESSNAIPANELQRMIVDTQGWAAGLVLAVGAWQRDHDEGYPPCGGTTGLRNEFASYFHEEVLAGLPQNIRDFLVDTSILEELTPSACAAVVDTEDARVILEDVFERGLFLAEIDRELSRYRYYSLFRETVLGRLAMRAPERASRLHCRASRFFGSIGEFQQALDHAVQSGDKEFLADQLEQFAEPMIYGGLLYRVDELASDLPWELLQNCPSVLLAMSWRRSRRLAFKSSERMIEGAQLAIAKALECGEIDEYQSAQIQMRVRHRQIMLAAARDNMPFVERESELLLDDLGDDHPYLSCTLLAQLLSARRELYHFHDMLRLEAELRKALGRPGSDFASIALKSSVAPTLVAQGKTQLARQFLTEAHGLAIDMEGQISGLAALPALPLAELHYECGELDDAARLVEGYLPSIPSMGFC